MREQYIRITIGLLVALLWPSPTTWAHHSPSEVIEALSDRIAKGERTPKILVRRGDEYRALGKNEPAIADYLAALKIEKNHPPAVYGLANTHLAQQNFTEAMLAANQGIRVAKNPDEAAPFHAIAARIYDKQGKGESASAAWKKALTSSRPQVDWFLQEARSLQRQGAPQKARQALEQAMTKNPSIVLRRAWLEALVQSGDTDTAAKHIEAGLARSRWKSSWLLLRAKLNLAQHQPEAARRDAQAALQEINSRQRPNTENHYLAAAREQSLAILKHSPLPEPRP
ncbi:MAG: tetratricopeptide repeat protein [Planctomycetes bacterium]|nr:tetratricopeptide repeat protein [Planctomycetota bacterium]